jgi:hypothetical protein
MTDADKCRHCGIERAYHQWSNRGVYNLWDAPVGYCSSKPMSTIYEPAPAPQEAARVAHCNLCKHVYHLPGCPLAFEPDSAPAPDAAGKAGRDG